MPTITILKPKEVIKAFQMLGWEIARQRGSHIILVKESHIATLSVPNHPEVARGTLRALIARAGLTVDEFLEALES
jgi:predicted RNA binding protein YcfA (HicA-like mRNA interferase family)